MKTFEINKDIYLPERLFVHNFFEYCNCTIDDFLEKINDIMRDDIINFANKLKNNIKKCPKNNEVSIYPTSFLKFTKECIYKKNVSQSGRVPDYFLTKCYSTIESTFFHLSKREVLEIGSDDLKYLNDFLSYIEEKTSDDFGAVSSKSLKRLLDPNGEKFHGNTQLKLINYIVKSVFPVILTEDNKINDLQYKWKELLFYYGCPLERKIYIAKDIDSEKKLEEFFENKFNYISNKSKGDCTEIGKCLFEIFTKIIDQYKCNCLCGVQSKDYSDLHGSQYENKIEQVRDENMFNGKLSSHILGFMRWLPIIPDDSNEKEYELLKSIDNVIDKIQDKLFDKYSMIFFDKNLKNCNNGEIFIGVSITDKDGNINYLSQIRELRKLLIDALYSEEYIKNMFNEYYKKSMLLNEGGIISE